MKRLMSVMGLIGVVCLTSTFGETILISPSVNNGSFETAQGGWPNSTGYWEQVAIDGWAYTRVYTEGAKSAWVYDTVDWLSDNLASEGHSHMYFYNNGLMRTLSTAAVAGEAYTLKVDYGNPASQGATYTFKVEAIDPNNSSSSVTLINENVIIEQQSGTWSTFEKTSNGLAATYDGWNIKVTVIGGVTWAGLDNVRLSSSPVPEPATMALLGFGSLFLIRRRK